MIKVFGEFKYMIIDFNIRLYSYDNFLSDANKLVKQYEKILQYVTIGTSHDNRDIILLKLGNGQQTIVCSGGVHARETINPIVLLKIIEYYADLYVNYKQKRLKLFSKLGKPYSYLGAEYDQMLYGTCIYELLQTFSILFVPLLNPDGYTIALEGFEAIRDPKLREKCITMQQPSEQWKYNARGIDINRNFPSVLWKKKFDQDNPASENETKALISLFQAYKSKGYLDFHSRGKQIYYYRSVMPDSYNHKQLDIALALKNVTNYELVMPEDEIDSGDTGGNTVHYFSEYFHKPALTIETVDEPAEFPLENRYRSTTFEELKYVIFEFGSRVVGL
jgi:Zinc carboxypeptidase.